MSTFKGRLAPVSISSEIFLIYVVIYHQKCPYIPDAKKSYGLGARWAIKDVGFLFCVLLPVIPRNM